MFKFLLILLLVIYVVYKISTFLLKQFIVKNFSSKKKIYKDGINIESEPNKNKKGILDGEGDFVDYEEVD
ncbi:MAG TPA: hypothetical protein EYQ68_03110 [Cytophagales bacterium]|jgi:hypothetical protein|nr:hypothetical protein [Cytophagales bacterium]